MEKAEIAQPTDLAEVAKNLNRLGSCKNGSRGLGYHPF